MQGNHHSLRGNKSHDSGRTARAGCLKNMISPRMAVGHPIAGGLL